jgi:hypothetical protein
MNEADELLLQVCAIAVGGAVVQTLNFLHQHARQRAAELKVMDSAPRIAQAGDLFVCVNSECSEFEEAEMRRTRWTAVCIECGESMRLIASATELAER